ncbi:MAG: ABC transporter substrate-binding protein, partial [Opitutales bacterium]
TFTPSQYARASFIVETSGNIHEITPAAAIAAGPRPVVPPPGRQLPWRIQLIQYVETPPCEEAVHGLLDGLKNSGLVEGRDYVLRQRNAQNDMATIPALFDAAATDGTDLYFTFSTPTLQVAIRKVTLQPLVFTFVSDPMAAGAAQSYDQHLPNLTGVSTLAPAGDMIQVIKTYFPEWKRIGTIYCPAEVNSLQNLKVLTREAQSVGLKVEAVPANNISELPDAARALMSRNLDAVVQIADNLGAAGFGAIVQAAHSHNLPVFAFQSPAVTQGASLAVSRDFYQAGLDAADQAARIMRGESPASIPITLASKETLAINLTNARDQGLTIPPALQKAADLVLP